MSRTPSASSVIEDGPGPPENAGIARCNVPLLPAILLTPVAVPIHSPPSAAGESVVTAVPAPPPESTWMIRPESQRTKPLDVPAHTNP